MKTHEETITSIKRNLLILLALLFQNKIKRQKGFEHFDYEFEIDDDSMYLSVSSICTDKTWKIKISGAISCEE